MAGEGAAMVPVTISAVIINRGALREGLQFREDPGTGAAGGEEPTGPGGEEQRPDHFIKLTEHGGERALHIGVGQAQAILTNGAVIDARPSDAVNLAAITGAPVLVAAELLGLPADGTGI
jgi:hypothetical protein